MTDEKKKKEALPFSWPEMSRGGCDLYENIITIYARPKWGKSTLVSQFPDVLFFDTENGTRHLQVKSWQIKDWTQFMAGVANLEKAVLLNQCPFKTVAIDTVSNLTDMCSEFICRQNGVNLLGDMEYGKGYAKYEHEFKKQINVIQRLGLGIVFVAHAEEKDHDVYSLVNPYASMLVNPETGMVTMTAPRLEKRAKAFILGMSDIILFGNMNKEGQRILYSQPSHYFEAGDRSGNLPSEIVATYDNLVNAYYGDNTQPLKDRIGKAEAYLKENEIEFTPTDLDGLSVAALETRLQELKTIARSAKKK